VALQTNILVRSGVSMLGASAVIWLGTELARRVEWFLSYTASVGALLLLIGLSSEVRRYKAATLAAARNTRGSDDPDPRVSVPTWH
jgi:hypothetical protein